MTTGKRHDAVNNLYPEVRNQSDNDCFDEKGNPITVDEDKVKIEIARLQKILNDNQYQRDRQYPALGEQLDMLFHDMTAGKGTKDGEWYKAVAKVKADNPKPTE